MPSLINDLIYRPEWFIPTESIFEVISLLITFFISFYSYRVYRFSNNRRYKYLAVGFFSMSLGFLFKLFSNLVVLYTGFFLDFTSFLPFLKASYFYTGSLVLYGFLILSGYVILACLALGIRNRKTILLLLFIALLASVLIRQTRSFAFFYFFAFVLLLVYILPYMYGNYKKQTTKNSFLVFSSFLLLTLANFLLIRVWGGGYYSESYIVGQSISLLAYIILLINLVLVLKK